MTEDGPTTAIEAIRIDLESDGISEVVAVSADYGSGTMFSSAEAWSFAGAPTSLARFELSLRSCLYPDGEYYESTLLSGWDAVSKRRCFLKRRRELSCQSP